MSLSPRDRLILAIDKSSLGDAERLVAQVGDAVGVFKIGYHLAFAGGFDMARELVRSGKKVFIDMKLHDIDNTVAKGAESIAKLGATFLTVHAYPKTMAAALEGSRGSQLKILAVTILTSYNDDDVREAGFTGTVSEQVARRAKKANEIGIHGLVCSPEEAALVRPLVGSRLLVTPGIRPAGAAAGDQKRIMTPARAMAAGADYLVVGRPITEAADPKAAADAIVAEIAGAKAA